MNDQNQKNEEFATRSSEEKKKQHHTRKQREPQYRNDPYEKYFHYEKKRSGFPGILLDLLENLWHFIRFSAQKIRASYPIDENRLGRRDDTPEFHLNLTRKLFFYVLIGFGIVGLLIPLRPKTSALEKRDLTAFPKFTMASFLSGDYTSQISTWYADTFPFREKLINLDTQVQRLYGLNTEEIHGTLEASDEIPVVGEMESTLDTSDDSDSLSAEPEKRVISATDAEDENLEDGTIQEDAEKLGSIYVADGKGFSYFGFDAQGSTNYAAMINEVAENLSGVSNVYCLLAPTNIAVELSEEQQEAIGSRSQEEAFDYIYDLLDDNVTVVPVLEKLIKHNAEYIYFRTDHHWTADGAYYAYVQLMKAVGKTACSRDDYEKQEYPGLIGSYYQYSNQNPIFSSNPDTVVCYIPQVNDLTYINHDYEEAEGKVITDVTAYDAEGKYMAFIMGDEPLEEIDNPNVTDGSSILVFKESYGNCFVPFLVNNYSKVYVVDYRYYNGDLTDFVKENKIDDVVFLNNANALGTNNIQQMYSVW